MKTMNNSIGGCSKHIGQSMINCPLCASEKMENIKEPVLLKPIKAKPCFYSICFSGLQAIARDIGYNLVIHGSMDRDMDLVAIPWIDTPKSHTELLKMFCEYLGVPFLTNTEDEPCHFSLLPGGRSSYVINLNRGNKYNGYEDAQYYLDISITPLLLSKTNIL